MDSWHNVVDIKTIDIKTIQQDDVPSRLTGYFTLLVTSPYSLLVTRTVPYWLLVTLLVTSPYWLLETGSSSARHVTRYTNT